MLLQPRSMPPLGKSACFGPGKCTHGTSGSPPPPLDVFMVRMTVVACLIIGTTVPLSGQGTNDADSAMQVTKPSDRKIVLTRTFDAPRQKVFNALTKPDHVPRWFQPKQMSLVTYQADFRAGGTFRYVFQRPSGRKIEMRGDYTEVDPPRRWVHQETYDFSPLKLLVTTVL